MLKFRSDWVRRDVGGVRRHDGRAPITARRQTVLLHPVQSRAGPYTVGVTLAAKDGSMPERRLVTIVDDDESVRESLPDLLRSFGFEVEAFSSAEAFLAADCLDRTDCLVLDVAMPGMSGPELQLELARRQIGIPIVFVTAHSDPRVCQEVLDRGAVACLIKPFSETAIYDAVKSALDRD
jgi:CheY-like chemotaxis protein